ncbi:MAG: Co2+/Mg2+ efflux protein ApaG [Pseudomonadota bacterium]|nr:Co2+/Mg2+ efflux protein ApaG [Pseudomonadota bacterium]
MYQAVTRGFRVTVKPQYLREQSSPDEDRYVWAYTIEIANLGTETAQLLSRYWRITDAEGQVQEVRGPGVVGEQPRLEPGEAFTYTSGVPLSTPSGIMVGWYQMRSETGELFTIDVPAFSLDLPDAKPTLN